MEPITELLADLLDEYATAAEKDPGNLPSAEEYAPAVTALHHLLTVISDDSTESMTTEEIQATIFVGVLAHIAEYPVGR